MVRHYIPEKDLSLKNFKEFIEERKTKIRNKLCEMLNVKIENS